MTPDTHDDVAFEQWLRAQQTALDEDLADVLDLEAGLREVLILAQHTALGEDLAATLDLDAGLAAIVPESRPVPAARQGSLTDLGGSYVERKILKMMHVPVRWHLRTEMLTGGLDLAHEITTVLLRDYDPECPAHPASSFFPGWDGWFLTHMELFSQLEDAVESGFTLGRDFLAAIPDESPELAHLRKYWLRQLVRAVDIKERAREMSTEVTLVRSRNLSVEHLTLMQELVEYSNSLADTIHVLNDFVGEDMQDAGLDKRHLDGLRWSLSTKWPPSWQDEIDRDSVPIGNGVFEVQQGNTRTTSPV